MSRYSTTIAIFAVLSFAIGEAISFAGDELAQATPVEASETVAEAKNVQTHPTTSAREVVEGPRELARRCSPRLEQSVFKAQGAADLLVLVTRHEQVGNTRFSSFIRLQQRSIRIQI